MDLKKASLCVVADAASYASRADECCAIWRQFAEGFSMIDRMESYLTGPMVNKRYNITSMTRWRWEKNPELAFPPPIKINKRSYWRLEALELWERGRAPKPTA